MLIKVGNSLLWPGHWARKAATMAMARKCGACGKLIEQEESLEVSVSVIRPDLGDNQERRLDMQDDYCDLCVYRGDAVRVEVVGGGEGRQTGLRGQVISPLWLWLPVVLGIAAALWEMSSDDRR